MRIRVRAPATTANLGSGFDCVAVALNLWNELEVSEGEGGAGPDHLGVCAFARLCSEEGLRFDFVDCIPRERGLGSSAAVIALGLVAATLWSGLEPDPERLLGEGVPIEGHPDNLAAALAGGACLTWDGRIARIADGVPAVPLVLVPSERVNTLESRAALPDRVPHADAAFTAARAALLGAALASGSPDLFAASLDDRLHEPYRSARLAEIRATLPEGALGATLSGSGPAVVVWARTEAAVSCEHQLRRRFPDDSVLRLAVTPEGAGSV